MNYEALKTWRDESELNDADFLAMANAATVQHWVLVDKGELAAYIATTPIIKALFTLQDSGYPPYMDIARKAFYALNTMPRFDLSNDQFAEVSLLVGIEGVTQGHVDGFFAYGERFKSPAEVELGDGITITQNDLILAALYPKTQEVLALQQRAAAGSNRVMGALALVAESLAAGADSDVPTWDELEALFNTDE